jgi:hypothetical protein
MDQNPLAVGAVALAAGIGVGLLVPTTTREDELFGERRDELVDRMKDKAQQVGQVAAQSARRAAEAARQTAKETARSEAQSRGLVGGGGGQSSSGQQDEQQGASGDVTVSEVRSVGEPWSQSHSGQNGRSV